MSAERTSCPYCWHYDCAGHTPAVMAAATAMRESSTVQLDMPTCTGLAELVSAAGLLVDRLPGESRKEETAEPHRPEVFAYPESMTTAPKHVTHVEDCSAQHWLFDAGRELWYPRDRSGSYYSWPELLHYEGPLTEVPPAQSGEATA